MVQSVRIRTESPPKIVQDDAPIFCDILRYSSNLRVFTTGRYYRRVRVVPLQILLYFCLPLTTSRSFNQKFKRRCLQARSRKVGLAKSRRILFSVTQPMSDTSTTKLVDQFCQNTTTRFPHQAYTNKTACLQSISKCSR